jgi:cobalt-zinc-cadmium efflux system outer membrane protein
MYRLSYLVTLLAVLALIAPAQCAGTERDEINVDKLVEEALAAHPELRALEAAVEAAKHRAMAAGGFPDPTISYSYFVENIETRFGPQRSILQLVQPIPFPGKLSLTADIAGFDVRAAEEQLRLARLNITRETKIAFYSIAAIDEILGTVNEVGLLLDRFEEIVKTRLETGRAHQQDILKVQIERLKLEERELEYRKRRESLVYRLNTLLDRETETPIDVLRRDGTPALAESLDELRELAHSQPELRLARHRIDQRNLSLSLSRKQRFPDFTVGMSYFNIGKAPMDVPESGQDAWNVTIGIKVPLWFGKIREETSGHRSMLRYLELSYEATRERIEAGIRDLYNQYSTALEIVLLYRDRLVPRAEQSLSAAEVGYMAGEVDVLSLLDSERLLLELGIALAERRADVEKRIAELESMVGAELTRRE